MTAAAQILAPACANSTGTVRVSRTSDKSWLSLNDWARENQGGWTGGVQAISVLLDWDGHAPIGADMNVVAVILARGGSKRLPGKNIRLLAGKPLIVYAIEASTGAKRVSRTVVSTDDDGIASIASRFGANVPFRRPADLAQDETPSVDALIHAVDHLEAVGPKIDTVVLLQPTSPMRQSRHIDEAVDLHASTGVDTVTAISPAPSHPFWCWKRDKEEIVPFFSRAHVSMSRTELPPAFIENGAIYVIRRSLLTTGSLYGERIAGYLMESDDAIDIDTAEDFQLAEKLMHHRMATSAKTP